MHATPQQDVARGRPAAMTDIFVSYRHADGGGRVERLIGALTQAFGPRHVVCDIADRVAAADLAEAIDHHLHSVDIVLVLIGPNWLAADGSGQRFLESPDDRICAEIRAALGAGKPVWPVLLGGAALPAADALPSALSGLARRPVVALDDATWTADVARLIAALRPRQAPPAVQRSGLWELTATVGVLVASLLIGDAWIAREVDQRAASAVAIPAAGQFANRWAAVGGYPQSAAPARAFEFLLPEPAPVGPAGEGALASAPAADAADGAGRNTSPHPRERREGDGGYLVLERTAGEAGGPPLSFVDWKNEP